MKVTAGKKGINDRGLRYIGYAISTLLLLLVHILVLNLFSLWGFTPDLLLILAVWIALSEGRFTGLFAGFFIGLMFDIITNDVVGTNALSKTIAAFVAGFFYREGKTARTIGSLRFLLIVFLSSLVHNLVYFFFYIKASELSYTSFFIENGLAISLYTTVFAVFAMFIKMPKRGF